MEMNDAARLTEWSDMIWTATGRIESFVKDTGWGTIMVSGAERAQVNRYVVVFHVSAVVKDKSDRRVTWMRLGVGARVEFDAEERPVSRGWRATQVRLVKA